MFQNQFSRSFPFFLLSLFTFAQSEFVSIPNRPTPLESESDNIGGLRMYGPVEINDVTGKVQVKLPPIGPSALLSVSPIIRTALAEDQIYPIHAAHLVDNFYAMGVGGSMGWGHFWVLDPTEDLYITGGTQEMTYFQHGGGSPSRFSRDYLFVDHNDFPTANQPQYFTFQNTIDRDLRRMCWQNPGSPEHFLGDYVLLEPSGRKITFRRRIWVTDPVNGGVERLYYPIRVEDPDGEWIDIHYRFDNQGNQTFMMDFIEDNHGRKLGFSYNQPLSQGQVKQIHLYQPGENPGTAPGFLLASFTYTFNGLIDPNGNQLMSLDTLTDAQGYQWRINWGTTNPAFALKRVVLPSGGEVLLDWEIVSMNAGRFATEPINAVTQWRVTQLEMNLANENRIFHYQWETIPDPGTNDLADPLLKVTINGPENLEQITHYNNMPTKYLLQTAGGPPVDIRFPDSGEPLYRRTSNIGGIQWELWEHEAVYLWSTDFQPPHSGALGNPGGNALNWTVRPKRYSLLQDGQWYDTDYSYGFNHPYINLIQGVPNASITAPVTMRQTPRGASGPVSFRKQLTYENRVTINGECHQYFGDTPYVLSLPTSELNIYTSPAGTEEILLKTTTAYAQPSLPYPTKILQWATSTSALETNIEYYLSGPYSGKTLREYVGPDPAIGVVFSDYLFGEARMVTSPLLPTSVSEIDYRGNFTSKEESGVVTDFEYDNINRVTRITRPIMLDEITEYNEPNALNLATTYYQDGSQQRRWAQTEVDGWNRPMSTEADISALTSGIEEIEYNLLGQKATTRSTTGSERLIDYDVFGRKLRERIQGANGVLLQQIDYDYEALTDGKTATTQTITREGKTTVKQSVSDFAGRLVETAFNQDRPGVGGPMGSDDYAGGGGTVLTHSQDQATGLITTVIKPYGLTGTGNRIEVRDRLDRLVSVTDPEYGGGSVTFEHNDRGLVAFATYPDGIKYHYVYDAEGRLLEQRQRTAINPEVFDRIITQNTYHPTFGFIENQAAKLEDNRSRVGYAAREPDELGRPEYTSREVAEPLYWIPETERIIEENAQGEQVWQCRWNIMPEPNILAHEYLLELKPLDSNRASLYFPRIHPLRETDDWVTFTLDNQAVLAAIEALPATHPDRQDWLTEAEAGTQMSQVLAHDDYRFRITGIDAFHKSGLTTYWWGDLPELLVDRLETNLTGSLLDLDFRVFNGGTRKAESTVTKIYLSQTPELPSAAQSVAEWITPAIEPGFAALHGVAQIDVSGFAYVLVVADANREIDELQEGNNTARSLLAWQGQPSSAAPDVVVEEMNYAYVILGQRYETYATYAIQNQSTTLATDQDGTESDGSSTTHLFFSSDNIISNDDTLLASPICSPLEPLAREIQTTSLGIYDYPVPLHTTHLVAALNRGVDPEPHFDEGTNTFNNVATIELPENQQLGPNLVIHHFLHQGVTGGPGNLTMEVEFTLWNAGVWQAGPSQVGFYHSYDDQLDANDTRLTLIDGSDAVMMDRIYPGWEERAYGTANLSLPDQEGYLIVVADVADQIVESDEENGKSQSFAGYADLAFFDASHNSSDGTWTLSVINQGDLDSQPTKVSIFVDFQDQYRPYSAIPVWANAFSVPSLRPGEKSAVFQTPQGWAPPSSNRDTWLFFVVDATDQVHERDEYNNSTDPFYVPGTGQNDDKPDLIPDLWGLTREIWPDATPLTAPDVEVSEFNAHLITHPGSNKPVQGSVRLRVEVGTTPIQVQLQVIASADTNFGTSDDFILRDMSLTFTESQDLIVPLSASVNFNPPRDHLQVMVTTDVSETRVTNNSAYTRFSLPDVMAVHSVTNQSSVGCGANTVAVYMSQDSLPQISPQDDLISLYLNPGFSFGGTQSGHMIEYGPDFMDLYDPLTNWNMKFAVDILDAIDESDETNNVLVTDPNPAAYSGPWLPAGLPPLPNPGPGSGYAPGSGIDHTTAVTQVLAESFLQVDDTALYDLRFKLKNNGKTSMTIDNLSIFASPDFGLKNASLVFSSMLVGDANGNKTFPTQVPSFGESGIGQYTLRIPQKLMGTPYKLIFVGNGRVYDHREGDPVYLNFDGTETRIMGILEPINL